MTSPFYFQGFTYYFLTFVTIMLICYFLFVPHRLVTRPRAPDAEFEYAMKVNTTDFNYLNHSVTQTIKSTSVAIKERHLLKA